MTSARSERETPLVPAEIRWPATLMALCGTLVLVALAVRYHGDRSGGRVDNWVFAHIPELLRSHHRSLVRLAEALPVAMVVVAGVLAVLSGLRRRWRSAALAVLAPAVTIALTEVGKLLVDRRIGSYLALPSGHTAGATSVFLVLGVILLNRMGSNVRLAAALVVTAVTVVAALVGLLMVSLHDHYATDTVAGYCLAFAVTVALAFVLDGTRRRAPEVDPSSEARALVGR